jgi:hypothetical protein
LILRILVPLLWGADGSIGDFSSMSALAVTNVIVNAVSAQDPTPVSSGAFSGSRESTIA